MTPAVNDEAFGLHSTSRPQFGSVRVPVVELHLSSLGMITQDALDKPKYIACFFIFLLFKKIKNAL
jgi:hypothetical protein